MIRRLLPQAFGPVLVLALVGTLAPAPAAASLPSWPDRHLLAAELKGEALLPAGSEIKVAAPHVHGAFCPHALRGPAADLELPRTGWRLPGEALTASEAEAVLAQPDVTKPLGLRDRVGFQK